MKDTEKIKDDDFETLAKIRFILDKYRRENQWGDSFLIDEEKILNQLYNLFQDLKIPKKFLIAETLERNDIRKLIKK